MPDDTKPSPTPLLIKGVQWHSPEGKVVSAQPNILNNECESCAFATNILFPYHTGTIIYVENILNVYTLGCADGELILWTCFIYLIYWENVIEYKCLTVDIQIL